MTQPTAFAALAVCVGALALPQAALADEGDIVVTAVKREDRAASDLPMALNVFSAAELEALNVEDLQSLSYSLPNVQFEDIGTARGIANFSIRGVGVNSSIASVDPAVGVFVDGVYLGLNAGTLTDLFDVEAIEVLRGSQGTLYGRNTTGGAVLVRTRAPTATFEARSRVAIETGTNAIAEAAISGPLGPQMSARFSIYHAEDEGSLTNDFNGSSFGQNETNIYRASLRLQPTEALELLFRTEQGFVDGDGPAGQNHALHQRGSFDFAIDNEGYAATNWEDASLTANWRVPFGDGVITSISAWRSVEVPWAADIDSTTSFVFHTRVLNAQDQLSQELRYAGDFGPLAITTGLYYLEQNLLYIDERNFSPSFRRVGGGRGRFDTWAIFAQGDWRISDTVTFGLGVRYTEENKVSEISRVRRAIDDLDGPGTDVPGEGVIGGDIDTRSLNYSDTPFDQHWQDLSPHLSLAWKPNQQSFVYATWSRAFRGGGANFRTSSLGLAPRAYEPEDQSSFELGVRQTTQNRRASLNVALFRNDISDMQRETNQPDPISGVQQIVLNAGDAVLWGGEIEATLQPIEGLRLSANAGYVHGAYERVTEDLNGDLVIDGADSDLEIPRLAPWSYGASASYEAPLFGGSLQTRVSFNHRDASFYNDSNLGRLAEGDMVSADISFEPLSESWRLSLYGENLGNEATWGGDTILPSTASFGYSGRERPTFSPLNKGRVLGVALRAQFH